jgi:hypothetical protein
VIKTTGAEIKAFWNDQTYWGECAVEEEVVTVNGKEIAEGEFDTRDLLDNDRVTIDGGFVWDQRDEFEFDCDLSTFFRRWRKQQTTAFLAVEVPKEKADAVRAAIVAAGGKVK